MPINAPARRPSEFTLIKKTIVIKRIRSVPIRIIDLKRYFTIDKFW
jgi:hypothetical protein